MKNQIEKSTHETKKPNQYQLYEMGRRRNTDFLKDLGFLCGLFGDNPNPLTNAEIITAANAKKSYSAAFQNVLESKIRQELRRFGDNKPGDQSEQDLKDHLLILFPGQNDLILTVIRSEYA